MIIGHVETTQLSYEIHPNAAKLLFMIRPKQQQGHVIKTSHHQNFPFPVSRFEATDVRLEWILLSQQL